MTLKYEKSRKSTITTSDYNKFTSDILDAKIKQKVAILAMKAGTKAEQDKCLIQIISAVK